ncbi:MAG: peptidyl-tRNA hydrolase Pth2 [Thermoplasmatota archaeon]
MRFDYKMVLVVREDLDLSKGKLAVQVSHAAVTCAVNSKNSKYFKNWYEEGQKKVVVRCKDLDEMIELKNMADNEGLTTCIISDAGITEVKPGSKTCLGIGPGPNDLVDKITGNLPLL